MRKIFKETWDHTLLVAPLICECIEKLSNMNYHDDIWCMTYDMHTNLIVSAKQDLVWCDMDCMIMWGFSVLWKWCKKCIKMPCKHSTIDEYLTNNHQN